MAAIHPRMVELLRARRLAAGSERSERMDTAPPPQMLLAAMAQRGRPHQRPARKLGVRERALGLGGSSHGAWAMAGHVTVQQALKNATLRRMGLGLPWEDAAAAGNR